MKNSIAVYNKKRSLFASFGDVVDGVDTSIFPNFFPRESIAIVIPACDEFPGIFETLYSLTHSIDTALCHKNLDEVSFFVIIVVNNTKDAVESVQKNNQHLLHGFKNYTTITQPCVAHFSCANEDLPHVLVLDCSSVGHEMPMGQGVGWARKYGMDYALLCGAKVIACMDADTLVSENYAHELFRFLCTCRTALAQKKYIPVGAVTHFKHQKAANEKTQKAIDDYEFFIKNHSDCLKKTGTPYWVWALGPTIVCSAEGYASVGGMNKRLAGEDFYFLQSLIKLHIQQGLDSFLCIRNGKAQVADFPILDCWVYPQSRFSNRVLFGTGKKVQAIVTGNDKVQLYPKDMYKKIEHIIDLFIQTKGVPNDFSHALKQECITVWNFLEKEHFFSVWDTIYCQNKTHTGRLYTAFHSWFDGLKILRLIHFLDQ